MFLEGGSLLFVDNTYGYAVPPLLRLFEGCKLAGGVVAGFLQLANPLSIPGIGVFVIEGDAGLEYINISTESRFTLHPTTSFTWTGVFSSYP